MKHDSACNVCFGEDENCRAIWSPAQWRVFHLAQKRLRQARTASGEDSLWTNMQRAGARLGWRSRLDVPHAARMYMHDKRDALTAHYAGALL